MEFQLHHHVDQLTKALGITETDQTTSTLNHYAEYLEENRTPYVTMRRSSETSLKRLTELSQDSSALLQKYESLKSENFRELECVVDLISQISLDPEVRGHLWRHSQAIKMRNRNSKCNSFTSKQEEELNESKSKLHSLVRKQDSISKSQERSSKFSKWIKDRPSASWDFSSQPRSDNVTVGHIGVLPSKTQEYLLLNDILFCFSGIDGDYIMSKPCKDPCGKRAFTVDETADPPLLELTKRIVPIFSDYSTVISFVEEKSQFEYGFVNHALCAAMRDMLKEYFILIAQLESQHLSNELTLQKMWYYIQDTMVKLRALASVAQSLNKGNCIGGTVLSVLHDRATILVGDKTCQQICFHLAQKASIPYFEILEKWIYKGMISDPYHEFFVQDNEVIKKEDGPVEYSTDYWEKRYTINRENIPVFLEKVVDMILRTGKYLNVIRQCGDNIKSPAFEPLKYVIGEQLYFDHIQKAYQFASKKLLDLLMDKNDLKGRLKSLKHYFLLDEGDFLIQFMDMAEEELNKPIDDIMPTRLETLLELALRTSAISCDKYKDDVKVILLMENLQTQMSAILNQSSLNSDKTNGDIRIELPISGIEAFAFDYEVKWPLSLIINYKAIHCYQFIFRHLFHFKHVEALLGRVWTLNKIAKSYPLVVSSSYSYAFALCQRMLNFIHNLDYYFTLEVIEPNWQFFQQKILQVTNVDEVLQYHDDFLNACIQNCMLTFPELLCTMGKLVKLCISFSNFMQETHEISVEAEFSSMGSSLFMPVYENSTFGGNNITQSMTLQLSFKQKISQFETDFDSLFVKFLQMITELSSNINSTKMLNMLYRLDFNGYYASKQTKEQLQTPAEE